MKPEKTNEELVALIQDGINVQENMGLLLEKCRGYVYAIAKKSPRTSVFELEDLIQEGLLGVMKAVKSYNNSRDCSFVSYASYYIMSNIEHNLLGPLLDVVRIPSHMFTLIRKYKKYEAAYQAKFNELPSDEEVIRYLKITKKNYKAVKQLLYQLKTTELDAFVEEGNPESMTRGDSLIGEDNVEDEVLETIYQNECSIALWNCLELLGDREAIIILERYFDNMTLQRIAELHNITNTGVDKIVKKCLSLLREMEEIKALREDYDYKEAGIKGTGFRKWKETGESSVERAVRKKLEFEENYKAKLERLQDEASNALEDLTNKLMNCEKERRKEIENLFNRKYDEIVPHILTLPERMREVFVMRFVLGMSYRNMAKQTNTLQTSVETTKRNAISWLKKALLA